MTKHPSTFELKCHFAQTKDNSHSAEIASHLRSCKSCQRVIAQFEAAQAELVARKPASLFLQQLETRALNEKRQTRSKRFSMVAAVATVGVLCIVLATIFRDAAMPNFQDSSSMPTATRNPLKSLRSSKQPASGLRWMGQKVTAKIHILRDGKTFISEGTRPRNGDQLRYEVVRQGTDKAYASVFAIQDGEVIALLPQSASQSPYEFTDHLVVPGSVVVEPGGEAVELLLFVQSTNYTIESVKDELIRRLSQNEDLSTMNGLVHRFNATPASEEE